MNYAIQNKIDIPIDACVHYRGFRYGLFTNNPYEDYIVGLATGEDINRLKISFIRRVLGMRADHFGQTLGLSLHRKYSNWNYPWQFSSRHKALSKESNPDIVCHTSENGKILASHLNREFRWLEASYNSIQSNGYRPEAMGYVTLLSLRRGDETRYIVTDGNHRLSAMAALGVNKFRANVIHKWWLNQRCSPLWIGNLTKKFDATDSIKIHNRYFWKQNPQIEESNSYDAISYDEDLNMDQRTLTKNLHDQNSESPSSHNFKT